MEIKNETDLANAAKKAGNILQDIQDYLTLKDMGHSAFDQAKVRFPRGFIRTATSQRSRLNFIENKNLKSNIAYTIMLSDTVLWLINRTDISGIPKAMLFKLQIMLVGSVVESITKEYLKNVCGKNYKKRTEYLVKNDAITPELKMKLDWIWDQRNYMHLFLLDESEYLRNEYTKENHNRCVSSLRDLLRALNEKCKNS